jgi:DNA-binding transcriptional regulator LsrR (DeoR family)
MDKQALKLDQAARAAWLYYVGGNTQDEIAARLNVSRPGAQRLLALAREAGLVKVHIDHPVADCMELAGRLRRRFGLDFCDVVPADADAGSVTRYLAVAGAVRLEEYVARETPLVLNLGTGRTLRAAVEAMSRVHRPQHRFVSLVGNVARDGSSNPFDAVMVLADKTGGRRFLLPAQAVADSVEEREQLMQQRIYQAVLAVSRAAEATFVGIGQIDRHAPLHQDGFITDDDLDELLGLGAVGEILGWAMDRTGKLIDSPVCRRVTSVSLQMPPERPFIAMAGGIDKGAALVAALSGGWLTGLITDEAGARFVLDSIEN